ncbi:hypothetical protein MRB53_011149 [Persea americana]|uniref:Uncharacterized protein n=1 Tax=Persea americana TaxID=3435 RepID=A0ACC2LTT6_PERAE|nr:hypothetical protein MRB53_011149 [Persea americana]
MYSERKVRATYGRWTRDQLAGNDITTLGTYVMDQSRITLKTRAVGVNTAIATGYFESASGVGRPYHWAQNAEGEETCKQFWLESVVVSRLKKKIELIRNLLWFWIEKEIELISSGDTKIAECRS